MKFRLLFVRAATGRKLYNNQEILRTKEQLEQLATEMFGNWTCSHMPNHDVLVFSHPESPAILVAIAE